MDAISTDVLEDLRSLTHKIMAKEGVLDYELNIEGQSEKGDNYADDIIFFNTMSKQNGKQYKLVMKTAKRSEGVRKVMRLLYKREMYIYSEVFPKLHAFAREFDNLFEFDYLPKVHWVNKKEGHETLIMENLKSDRYRVWDRTKPMSLEHILLVLKNYGKYHALSMAFSDQNTENFQSLVKGMQKTTVLDLVEPFEHDFRSALKLLMKYGENDLVKKFENIAENLGDLLKTGSEKKNKIIISHGDCWTNNMMFKYENDTASNPVKVCFLDFQLSTLESPVTDISNYIYTSCDDVALDQFDVLLKTYHDSFSATMKNFGSDPDALFTFEQLKQHWKESAVYGLIFAPLVVKIALCSSEVAPEMDDIGKEGKNVSNVFDYELENEEAYFRRMLAVFTHYSKTCLEAA